MIRFMLTMMLLGMTFGLAAHARASPVVLYIAPDGDDSWSGSHLAPTGDGDGPLATLTGARDRLRKLREREALAAGATVFIRAGIYLLSETFALEAQDSGTPEGPITFAAYPGETVVIGGGRRITGWQPTDNGLWIASLPELNGKPWRFRQLFVNGVPQERARHPNTDNWREWPVTVKGYPHSDDHDPTKEVDVWYPEGAMIKNWPNLHDVQINILASWRWINAVVPLKSVDEGERHAILDGQAAYHINKGDPFRVENVIDAIDEPGEWCINTLEKTIAILPPEGVDMVTADVIAPALYALVRMAGTDEEEGLIRHIILSGLTFVHANRGVQMSNVEGCTVEGCRFIGLGNLAVGATNYVQNNRFVSNEMVECGAGGIYISGYPPGTKDVNHHNVLANNHIHHCGRIAWYTHAIAVRQSGENAIINNYIHHMPYIGISLGGQDIWYFRYHADKRTGNFRWDEIDEDPLTEESIKKFCHSRRNLLEGNVIHDYMQLLDAGDDHMGDVVVWASACVD